MKRIVPERPIRVVLLLAACAPPPLLLAAVDSDLDNWQDPVPWALAIFVAALLLLRGELHPALMDEEPARRAARYSLFVPPLLLLSAVLFPRTISWAFLWALSLVLLYLLAFAYVPRVRVAALAVSTTLSLGITVMEPGVAGILAAPALAWLAMPALETSVRARLGLTSAIRPRLVWPLSAIALCLALGVGVFAAAWSLLPPTRADFRQVGLLRSAGGEVVLREGPTTGIPWPELIALFVIVVVTLALFARMLAGSNQRAPDELEVSGETHWLGKLKPKRRARPRGAEWRTSPRLALIERYLVHLGRLGLDPVPRDTPARLLAELPQAERALAARLAERFERARWSPQPVEASDLAAAESEAAAIEEAHAKAQAAAQS